MRSREIISFFFFCGVTEEGGNGVRDLSAALISVYLYASVTKISHHCNGMKLSAETPREHGDKVLNSSFGSK